MLRKEVRPKRVHTIWFNLNEIKKHRQNESMVSEVRKLLVLRSWVDWKRAQWTLSK